MTLIDHIEAIKKEMASMSNQKGTNQAELERQRQEQTQLQLNIQNIHDTTLQTELQKAHETTKRLESLARTYLQTINDQSQMNHLLVELEQISKNGAPQMPSGIPPNMMNAVAAAAAMQQPQHMMMRNPMLNAIQTSSPRVPGKGVQQNNGMNGVMMHQMQMQAALVQAQAQAQAMMHAQMFPGMGMMVPGMAMGMPPGMAGLPGMMPPNSMAAAMQHFNQQMAAAAVAVSTPSRNPSTSGAASRTRTPLTASATNSPRPTTEPVNIKEEEPASMDAEVAAVTTAATIKQEENSTVAVA